jgi:probable rRNA maturation factor
LDLTALDVNVLVVSDATIRKYNKKYLKHDYVTDVIAFPMKEKGLLGDIMISSDTARRQAKDEGHDFLTELKILAIHGLLHLLGYRDKKKKDSERMWRKTDQLLKKVRHL